jgi:hypothetical protein
MDKNKDYLYKLLSSALIQIREDAHEQKNKKVFWISNLLHNLPSELSMENVDYKEVFDRLREDAKTNKMDGWFENEIIQIDKQNN